MTQTTHDETAHDSAEEERFARLTGYEPSGGAQNPPTPAQGNVKINLDHGTSEMTEEEVESQISRHSFGSHPIVKLVVVGGAVFLIVGAGAVFFYGMTGGNMVRKPKPTQPAPQTLAKGGNDANDKGELLTTLALQSQKGQLQKLGSSTKKPEPLHTVALPTTVVQQPPPPTHPVVPQRQIVRTEPTYDAPPMHYPAPPPIVREAPVRPSVVAKAAPPEDPYKQWKKWSEQGSFGSTQTNRRDTVPTRQTPTDPTTIATTAGVEPEPITRTAERRTLAPTDILPNTHARVVITTPVGFADQGGARYVNAILMDPINNASGEVVFPAESKLVLEIDRSEAPLVTLKPVSIDCNVNGQWVEYRLPEGAMAIFSATDKPLTASSRKVNRGGGSNLLGSAFRVIGSLGGTINLPGGNAASTVYNNLPHSYGGTQATRVYTLKSGTEVSLVTIQSFSLPPAVDPTAPPTEGRDY